MGSTYVRQIGHYHAFKRFPESDTRHMHAAAITHAMDADPRVTWHEQQIARQQQHRSLSFQQTQKLTVEFGHAAVLRIEEQRRRVRELRDANKMTIADPLYSHQWHLNAIGNTSVANIGADLAWNRHVSYRGAHSVVAIVDDGLNYMHPDISGNYKDALSYDFNGDNRDPMAAHDDTHGTSAAGVAAALANNVCGVGVCPDCMVAAMKLIAGPSSDYMEAQALSYNSDHVNVYSNSWGPVDDGRTMAGPGYVTKSVFAQNAVAGRGGKGSIWVWAGGNGGQNGDNANYDGYANSRYTIAVGAVGFDGKKAYYSEDGACLMVSAPSSGVGGHGITTIRTERNGESSCTGTFGGTSAAAPMVAGGIGLVLGKFPGLTRRDILHLLAVSSTKIDPADSDWTTPTPTGIAHNHKYGWGLLNMMEFTRLAINWGRVPAERRCSTGKVAINYNLGEGGVGDYNWSIELGPATCNGDGANITFVEYVEVTAWIGHASRGDLLVDLRDPGRVVSHLQIPHSDPSSYPSDGWMYGSARHFGRPMRGVWNVHVSDAVRNNMRGTVRYLQIDVYGSISPT